jgi:hypothetical protein
LLGFRNVSGASFAHPIYEHKWSTIGSTVNIQPVFMTPYRFTNIAVDFDRTFTSDVELWRFIVNCIISRGHSVFCVTGRTYTPDSYKEIAAIFGEYTFKRLRDIVFCDHSPKRATTLRLGYKIDIWIDDLPEGVGAADRSVFKQLEDLFPVCETLPIFGNKEVHPKRIWTPT